MIKTTEALSQKNEIYAKDLKAQLEANLLLRMEDLTNWSKNSDDCIQNE